jgi:hypothetical protein
MELREELSDLFKRVVMGRMEAVERLVELLHPAVALHHAQAPAAEANTLPIAPASTAETLEVELPGAPDANAGADLVDTSEAKPDAAAADVVHDPIAAAPAPETPAAAPAAAEG